MAVAVSIIDDEHRSCSDLSQEGTTPIPHMHIFLSRVFYCNLDGVKSILKILEIYQAVIVCHTFLPLGVGALRPSRFLLLSFSSPSAEGITKSYINFLTFTSPL